MDKPWENTLIWVASEGESIVRGTVPLTQAGISKFYAEMDRRGIQIEIPMQAALWLALVSENESGAVF